MKLPVVPGKVAGTPKASEVGALQARARLPALKAQDLARVSPVPRCNVGLMRNNKLSPYTPVQAGYVDTRPGALAHTFHTYQHHQERAQKAQKASRAR